MQELKSIVDAFMNHEVYFGDEVHTDGVRLLSRRYHLAEHQGPYIMLHGGIREGQESEIGALALLFEYVDIKIAIDRQGHYHLLNSVFHENVFIDPLSGRVSTNKKELEEALK